MTPSTLSPDHAERLLKLLLRLGGTLTGLALFAVFLPTDRMAAVHSALGLGEFPATPLVDYLTRTVSALYASHGAVLWVASFDVERSAPLIRLLGWGNIAFGGLLTGIQLHAGLPGWWIVPLLPLVSTLSLQTQVARRRRGRRRVEPHDGAPSAAIRSRPSPPARPPAGALPERRPSCDT